LREAINETTLFNPCIGSDVEEYIQKSLHDICFYPFDDLSMDAKPTWRHHFLELGNDDSVKKVVFTVRYIIVCNLDGRMDMHWSVDRPSTTTADTVAQTIAKIEEHRLKKYPNEKIRYTAVLRKQVIVCHLGQLSSYDVFEFPNGWVPQAG
jgi:hypothetical protein